MIEKCMNKVIRKFTIIVMCLVIAFGSVASKTTRVKAIAGVDDMAFATIICILLACGGVVMSDQSFAKNATKLATQAKDSFLEFCDTTVDISKNALESIVNTAVNTGELAVDSLNSLGTWLNKFVNDVIIPDYGIKSEVNADTPLFKFDYPIYMSVPSKTYIGSLTGKTYETVGGWEHIAVFSGETKYDNKYGMTWVDNGYENSYISLNLYKNGIESYSIIGFDGKSYSPSVRYRTRFSNGLSSSSYALRPDSGIYITGVSPVAIYTEEGLFACYGFKPGQWTKDKEGQLELDPDLYNKPVEGDLELQKNYDRLYDLTHNQLGRGWLLGKNATFDKNGNLVYGGTIPIPKDYTQDWANSTDYPYVLDKEISNTITKDDVTATYPDATFPTIDTSYTADWTTVFPFCIPFDIFKFLNLFCAEPETPKFTIDWNILGGEYKIYVDLSQFNGVAALCRNLFDILFIVGLCMVTRSHLIKA